MSNERFYQETFSQVHGTAEIRWEDYEMMRRGRGLKWIVTLAAAAALLAALLCLRGMAGISMTAAALGVFLRYRSMAQRLFGGISGDLAGWFLQTAELWMLAAACAAQYLESCGPFM